MTGQEQQKQQERVNERENEMRRNGQRRKQQSWSERKDRKEKESGTTQQKIDKPLRQE